jgi:non-canonical (house-cleaning) NTP pyrophosphatase
MATHIDASGDGAQFGDSNGKSKMDIIWSATVASHNESERRALQAALGACGYKSHCSASRPFDDCVSGVYAQPLSEAEVWRGAENRLADLIGRCDRAATGGRCSGCNGGDYLFVAVESGLWQRDGKWCDSACVIVERRGRFPGCARILSAPHEVPERHAALVHNVLADAGKTTLNSLIHAADPALPANAWFDRETQVRDALVLALQAM